MQSRPNDASSATVDLYWIPLGAGGHVVRLNGKVYEAIKAVVERRHRCDLYHTALEISVPAGRFVIESAPIRDDKGSERGVVGGPRRNAMVRALPAVPLRDPAVAGRVDPRRERGGVESPPSFQRRLHRGAHC